MQPKTYQELMDAANDARIATEDKDAITLYRQALAIGGDQDVVAHWMLGVSLINNEQFEPALKELNAVLKDCDDSDKPNVLRDRARVLTKLKKFHESAHDIAESLKLLEAGENKSEYGATLGFGARLKLEQGDSDDALADFKEADEILKAAENRHYELYNKLHYAEALIKHGDNELGRQVLAEADALIPQYGGQKHTDRSTELNSKLT